MVLPAVLDGAQEKLIELLKMFAMRGERVPFCVRCMEQVRLGNSVPQCLQITWAAIDSFYAVSTDYDPISKSVAINDLDASSGLLQPFFTVRDAATGPHSRAR